MSSTAAQREAVLKALAEALDERLFTARLQDLLLTIGRRDGTGRPVKIQARPRPDDGDRLWLCWGTDHHAGGIWLCRIDPERVNRLRDIDPERRREALRRLFDLPLRNIRLALRRIPHTPRS